ncbi:MAG: FmdB family zinc ribbon protein [Acidobacteriota bacterium]
MPIYEYECRRCGHRFELLQKFSDRPVRKCPECDGKVERLISAPAIRFKGTGWYVTDYANKGRTNAAEEEGSAEKKSGGAKDGGDSNKESNDSNKVA